MRKIETWMIQALRDKTLDAKKGNTRVYARPDGGHFVELHGNTIAHLSHDGRLRFTLAGWPTPTTRSRIQALLVAFANKPAMYYAVTQSKGQQYFHRFDVATNKRLSMRIEINTWVIV